MSKASILLVEDETPLLALLTKFLERSGYDVTPCETGAAALAEFRSHGDRFHLVILDLTLPDVQGEEVLDALLAESQLKIVISSGRPFAVETLPEDVQSRVAAILKPYMPKMLLEAMDSLLAESASAQ